jgi:hypothetical protein
MLLTESDAPSDLQSGLRGNIWVVVTEGTRLTFHRPERCGTLRAGF